MCPKCIFLCTFSFDLRISSNTILKTFCVTGCSGIASSYLPFCSVIIMKGANTEFIRCLEMVLVSDPSRSFDIHIGDLCNSGIKSSEKFGVKRQILVFSALDQWCL